MTIPVSMTRKQQLMDGQVPALTDAARETRSFRWIVVAAVAVGLLLAFRQNASLPATLGSTWTQVIMICCGGLWVVSRIYRDPDPNRSDGPWLVALAHFSVTTIAWAAAAMRGVPTGTDRLTMDLALLNDAILLAFYGFLLANLVSMRAVFLLVKVIVAGTALSTLYGLLDQFTGIDLASMIRPPLTRAGGSVLSGDLLREGVVRAQGAAGHPLELATIVATILPLSVALTFAVQARGERSRMWILCSGLLLLGMVTSLSRSALLGTGIAFAVMSLFWSRDRLVHLAKLAVPALALFLVVRPGILLGFVNVFAASGTDDSLYSREFGRNFAIDWWWQHPWLGIGHSAYAVPYYPVLDNQYLSRLVEDGAIGLVTLLVLWCTALAAALRCIARVPSDSAGEPLALRELGVGLAGVMIVVLFSNLVLDTFGFRQVSTLTWVLMALCWATARLARYLDRETDPSPLKEPAP